MQRVCEGKWVVRCLSLSLLVSKWVKLPYSFQSSADDRDGGNWEPLAMGMETVDRAGYNPPVFLVLSFTSSSMWCAFCILHPVLIHTDLKCQLSILRFYLTESLLIATSKTNFLFFISRRLAWFLSVSEFSQVSVVPESVLQYGLT